MAGRQAWHEAYFTVDYCPVDYRLNPPARPYNPRDSVLNRGHVSGGLRDGYFPVGLRLVDSEGVCWMVYRVIPFGRVLVELEDENGTYLIKYPMTILRSTNAGLSLSRREDVR